MVRRTRTKLLILSATIAVTVAIHYGWVLPYLFGHSPWVHAVHSRFCYIPIAIAAAWFGMRGGLISATAISLLVLPFVLAPALDIPSEHVVSLSSELVEMFFYFVFGVLIGGLVDRELLLRRRHEDAKLQLERSRHLAVVGQMAAGVAHEIKNPLASIKGAVEIAITPTTPENDRKEFQEIISKEIRRIDGTVREFLEYARPRPVHLEPLDLAVVLESTMRQLSPQVELAGARFEPRVSPNQMILGDRDKLHQTLLNLLLNALQASPAGSAIEVTLKQLGDREVVMAIRDHGRGIRGEDLPHIFEPFFTTKPSGSGLGLAIVKGVIEDHKGAIGVTSSESKGTTFTITFPSAGAITA